MCCPSATVQHRGGGGGGFGGMFLLFIILLSATASRLCSSCLTKSIGIASLDAPPNTSQSQEQCTGHCWLSAACCTLKDLSFLTGQSAYVWPVQGLFLRFGVHHLFFFFSLNDNSWLTGSMGDNYRASSGYRQLKINLLLHCQYCREVELKLGVLRERFVRVDPIMSLWRWQFCNLLQCSFHIQN